MGHKSRKGDERDIRLSETQLVQPGMAKKAADKRSADSTASEVSKLKEQYDYVAADLKRIAIIALVMMMILVSLTFVLP